MSYEQNNQDNSNNINTHTRVSHESTNTNSFGKINFGGDDGEINITLTSMLGLQTKSYRQFKSLQIK